MVVQGRRCFAVSSCAATKPQPFLSKVVNMAKKFFASFESIPNDFAAAKLRLGEYGVIKVGGQRYNVAPIKNTTQLHVDEKVFTKAGAWGIYDILAIDGRWYTIGKNGEKKGRVVHDQILGRVVV